MAAKGNTMVLALVAFLMICNGAWAQQECSSAIMSLSPCLKFVNGSSTKPSASCCSSLAGVIQSQPQCLCTLINGGGPRTGFVVDQTLALALPAACNMQSPPTSQCETASAPTSSASAASPAISPSSDFTPSGSSSNDTPDTTSSAPSETDTPSSTGSGSKTVPWTFGHSSNAISIKTSLPITMFFIFIVSFRF